MLTINKVYKAQKVLKELARKTELIYSSKINPKANIYLKTENLQKTGSFKVRGAYYKLSRLSEEEKARGVIACSAGNHAQGVALSAKRHNIKAVICIPEGAPLSKIEATRGYGAEVVLVKGVYDDAYKKALELQKEYGYTFIHPFDDEDVIAGQGTIALEMVDQLENIDTVLVPVGGGGLIAGIAFTLKTINPDIKVYGVEAQGASSMLNSLSKDNIEELEKVNTMADGIAVKKPGTLTYDLCKKYVDGIVTVSDDEIAAAILTLIERKKMISEGAGAVTVAAAMFNKVDITGKNVICLLSGGNIDVNILSRVINRGLLMTGRTAQLLIEVLDKPGQLTYVSSIISKLGANIISIEHERVNYSSNINECYIRVTLETKNFEHIELIKKELSSEGFTIK